MRKRNSIASRAAISLRISAKHVVLGGFAFVGLIPFFLVVLTSLKQPAESVVTPPVWAFAPTLSNYVALLSNPEFLRSVLNSVIIAGGSTVVSTIAGVMAGYAFSRFTFKGSGTISYAILILRMVPPITFVIPYFLLWRTLRMSDSYVSMILMYTTLEVPLLVWMMRSFFVDVPVELEEAAMVDGCSRWKALWQILIPAVSPGIFAASTLAFITVWNEFMFALYNTGRVTRTLPVEIYQSLGYYQLDWARLSTSAVIAIIPAVAFIGFAQKYIVRGLTMGSVKG